MTDFKDIRALLEKSASSDDLKRFDALMIEPPESGQIVPSAFQTPLRQSRRSSFEGPTEFSPYGAMPLLTTTPSPSGPSVSTLATTTSSSSSSSADRKNESGRFERLYEKVALGGLQSLEPLREGQDIQKYLRVCSIGGTAIDV